MKTDKGLVIIQQGVGEVEPVAGGVTFFSQRKEGGGVHEILDRYRDGQRGVGHLFLVIIIFLIHSQTL